MQIYEICKDNRIMLSLTLKEFADSVGVDVELYKAFEDGEYIFSKEIMKRIIKSLYVEKEDFDSYEADLITRTSLRVIEECEKGE